jgi:hypothetical protein
MKKKIIGYRKPCKQGDTKGRGIEIQQSVYANKL